MRGRPLSQLAAFRTAGDGSMRGTTAAELVDRTLCGEASLAIDVPLHARGGKQLVLQTHAAPMSGSGGAVFVAVDISAQRELESSRLGAARLHASREAKGQFLASVGHELRTPLSGVLGSIELAISRPMGPELKAPLATASASAKHLMAVLESMLTLSALEVRTRACV